jgi:hypothetical protein
MTDKRPIHLRGLRGGNNTVCGRGGVCFTAPITDDPMKITCKNCAKVWGAIESGCKARGED